MSKRMRKSLLVLAVAVILLLPTVLQVAADAPTRTVFTTLYAPFTEDVCGFPVQHQALQLHITQLEFIGKQGYPVVIMAMGASKARLTNLDTGRSIDINLSGPITVIPNSDGTATGVGRGLGLIQLNDGVLPNLPRLFLSSGRAELTIDAAGNITQFAVNGHIRDLCSELAAP